MSSIALSEGLTHLTHSHAGPGTFVHRQGNGAFVHIYIAEALDLANNNSLAAQDAVLVEEAPENDTLRVTVGRSDVALTITLQDLLFPRCVIRNLWVNTENEIWMSSSRPGKYVAYGCVTKKLMGEP